MSSRKGMFKGGRKNKGYTGILYQCLDIGEEEKPDLESLFLNTEALFNYYQQLLDDEKLNNSTDEEEEDDDFMKNLLEVEG
ncbi:hypothetical protein RDI58_026182 [Solanum bulbocastanum]|uniref:Uncharacterized protein n=1 Tax=Solanum bulbocastanum TaxID=147425 RepID=A0AAN8Y0X0_SOLBU